MLEGHSQASLDEVAAVERLIVPKKEREQTDASLLTEREEADNKYADRKAQLEEDADEVVADARERADAVLTQARANADEKLSDVASRDVAAEERQREDVTLRDERGVADEQLKGERISRARALAELLMYERQQTDQHLATERGRSDAAVVSRDDFLGMVSHDLRTLLGGMAMSTAALLGIPTEGEIRSRIEREAARLQRFTTRMTRLVGDLLDIVSIEAGKLQVQTAPHEANTLMRETLETFQPVAAAHGISLTGRVSQGSLLADFDRERILQVLANLLTNAIKFTAEGGTVALSVEPVGEDVRFTVTDNGAGIPADKVTTIFDRYAQGASYDRRGLGIGLFISKCIVEAHGGKIWVESRVGEGSTFHFTLPGTAEARTTARPTTTGSRLR